MNIGAIAHFLVYLPGFLYLFFPRFSLDPIFGASDCSTLAHLVIGVGSSVGCIGPLLGSPRNVGKVAFLHQLGWLAVIVANRAVLSRAITAETTPFRLGFNWVIIVHVVSALASYFLLVKTPPPPKVTTPVSQKCPFCGVNFFGNRCSGCGATGEKKEREKSSSRPKVALVLSFLIFASHTAVVMVDNFKLAVPPFVRDNGHAVSLPLLDREIILAQLFGIIHMPGLLSSLLYLLNLVDGATVGIVGLLVRVSMLLVVFRDKNVVMNVVDSSKMSFTVLVAVHSVQLAVALLVWRLSRRGGGGGGGKAKTQ